MTHKGGNLNKDRQRIDYHLMIYLNFLPFIENKYFIKNILGYKNEK